MLKINKSSVPEANKIPENTLALIAEISPLTKGLFLVLAILLSISTSRIWLITALEEAIKAMPLLMVLIIFIWTPPHFWALSINRKEDYVAAKIPMMPVIKGTDYTKLQIALYSVLLAVISIFPFATGYLGGFYFISATVLNAGFLGLAVALIFDKRNKLALPLFLYSIVFLTILFICMALDKLIPIQL